MPRKKQARSIYVTKEPDWKALRLIEGQEERDKAFDSCEYFARTEISSKKKAEAARKWIKNDSGWSKEEIKIIRSTYSWVWYHKKDKKSKDELMEKYIERIKEKNSRN